MNRIQHYFIDRPCENNVLFHARLNSEANIGQQPAGQTPPWHGNIWVDSARSISGYGAVNLNDASFQTLTNSLFTTNQGVPSHNPIIPLNDTLGPFYVNDQGWFSPPINPNTFARLFDRSVTIVKKLNSNTRDNFELKKRTLFSPCQRTCQPQFPAGHGYGLLHPEVVCFTPFPSLIRRVMTSKKALAIGS